MFISIKLLLLSPRQKHPLLFLGSELINQITITDTGVCNQAITRSVIGAGGIEKILELKLDENEQALMDNSANAVKGLIADLEKMGLL